MSNEKVEIKSLEIEIRGRAVSLSVQQARDLKRILDELFGSSIAPIIIHEPVYWPVRPIPHYEPYTITWRTKTDTVTNTLYCAERAEKGEA